MFDAKQGTEGDRANWIANAAINAQRDKRTQVVLENPWRKKRRRRRTTLREMGMTLFGIDIDKVKREQGLA